MGLSFWRHTAHLVSNPPFQPVPLPLLNGTKVGNANFLLGFLLEMQR